MVGTVILDFFRQIHETKDVTMLKSGCAKSFVLQN